MKSFKLYWLGTKGEPEIVEGDNIADAYSRAGYGAGALRALDYYEEFDPNEGRFPRVVMDGNYPIDSEEAQPFLEQAAEMAGEHGLPIHVQNENQFTVHIVFP